MESFGVTGNGRLWAGGGSSSNGLSLCNKSAEKRGTLWTCLPPTNPLCSCKCGGGRAGNKMRKRDRNVDSFVFDCLFSTWPLAKSAAYIYALCAMNYINALYRKMSKTFPAFGAWVAFSNCVSTRTMSKSYKVFVHCNQKINKRKSFQGMDTVGLYSQT